MKQFFLNLIRQVIKEEQTLYAVYVYTDWGKNKTMPLVDLEYIRGPFIPRVGEFIHLLRGDTLHTYKVVKVNHIYHYSGFELQEGNIIVEFAGEQQV